MDWLTEHKLPIGPWARTLVDWLTDNAYWVFDGISAILETLIDGILWLLQTPHPLVIVVVAVAIGTWSTGPYPLRLSWQFPCC